MARIEASVSLDASQCLKLIHDSKSSEIARLYDQVFSQASGHPPYSTVWLRLQHDCHGNVSLEYLPASLVYEKSHP